MNRPGRALIFSVTSLMVSIGSARIASSQDLNLDSGLQPLNPLSELDPLSFRAFLQRPLFSASRRPPADPAVEQASTDTASQDLDIRLLGIVVTPEGSLARITNGGHTKTRGLRRGDLYDGWQVLSVDQSTLKLGRNGETRLFSVFAKPTSNTDVRIAAEKPTENIAGENNADQSQSRIEVPMVETSSKKLVQERPSSTQEAKSNEQDLIDFFGPTGQPAE